MKILPSKLHLKQRLYSHHMAEGTSLEDRLTTASNLEPTEIKYDEEDLKVILLCSLSPSYSNIRDTI